MSSELLYALTPVIARRRPSTSQQQDGAATARPELCLQPVLVRPRDDAAHRSELEYAMTEIPSPVARPAHSAAVVPQQQPQQPQQTPSFDQPIYSQPSPSSYIWPDPVITHYNVNTQEYSQEPYASYPQYNNNYPFVISSDWSSGESQTLSQATSPTFFEAPPPPPPQITLSTETESGYEWQRARLQWEQEQESRAVLNHINTSPPQTPQEYVQVSPVDQAAAVSPLEPSIVPTLPTGYKYRTEQRPGLVRNSSEPSSEKDVETLKTSLVPFIAYQAPSAKEESDADQPLVMPHEEESEAGSDGESVSVDRPKRRNGRDNRILTIKHAMRVHILRAMGALEDKIMPDSHVEGEPLPADSPIRFVWESTILKSAHNKKMRRRVVADLQANKAMYPHVPSTDFEDAKALDATFEQAFTTFRAKWRSQRHHEIAIHEKRRDQSKAAKSRRFVRKRAKMHSRVEARKSLGSKYSDSKYDVALMVDCMSSEESSSDQEAEIAESAPGVRSNKTVVLTTRPPPWRSAELELFYATLDDAAAQAPSSTVRRARGMGRKQRVKGAPREPRNGLAISLPPKGVASWMINEDWRNEARKHHPALDEMLKGLVLGEADGGSFKLAAFTV